MDADPPGPLAKPPQLLAVAEAVETADAGAQHAGGGGPAGSGGQPDPALAQQLRHHWIVAGVGRNPLFNAGDAGERLRELVQLLPNYPAALAAAFVAQRRHLTEPGQPAPGPGIGRRVENPLVAQQRPDAEAARRLGGCDAPSPN